VKKSVTFVLALVLVFVCSSIAFAQTSPPTTVAELQKKEAHHTFKGTVVLVDAIANTIVVKGKKAEETFQVEPTTSIIINKKELKLADIKKETKVIVVYKVEGDNKVAVEIR